MCVSVRKLRSVTGREDAAHASMLASVGTAFKVRHFLRSLGDATKLVDSDRVRFAEPEGVICLICLHTCRRRWKQSTAPAASAASMNSAFCISIVLSSILSTKRTAKRDFFHEAGPTSQFRSSRKNRRHGSRPPGSLRGLLKTRRQAEKRRW